VLALISLRETEINRDLALSEVELEERNRLLTPVYHEEEGKWLFLAIYEVAVNHLGGPVVTLHDVCRVSGGSGFLVLLAGDEVVKSEAEVIAFTVEPSLEQIKTDPGLLKEVMTAGMESCHELAIELTGGEMKTIRFGVALSNYRAGPDSPSPVMALVSFCFNFDHGRSLLFRRGFPLPPLPPE